MEEKLIEAVRAHKVLYDTSHKDYIKTKLKAQIWKDVAMEAGVVSGAEAKEIWEKLRHSLRDALRRQQKFVRSGVPVESLKQWKFQNQMGFLQPYMANKTQDGNLTMDTEDRELFAQLVDISTSSNASEEYRELQQEMISTGNQDGSQTLGERSPPPEHTESTKKFKRDSSLLRGSTEQQEVRQKLSLEEREKLLEQKTATNDSLYHFFISMYELTKTMPPTSQYSVRNEIYRVVTDMEGRLLDMSGSSGQSAGSIIS